MNPWTLIKSGQPVRYRPPFPTFDQFLKTQAEKYPHQPAIVFADLHISYQELDRFTSSLAHQLLTAYNLKSGDRLSFAFTNTPEIILLNYAAWRAGLVTVPLDTTRDTLDRKLYKLKFTGSHLLFTRPDPQNPKIKKALSSLEIIEVKDFSDFKSKFLSFPRHELQATSYKPRLDKDCLILFTSGTTALPKGVRLNLTGLFANAASIADWMQFNHQDRFHIILPLHHINSVTFTNTTLLAGGTVVLSSGYSKSKFWETSAHHQVTGTSIVPTIAYDLLSEEASFRKYRHQLKHYRRIQIGSAPVQPTVVETFMKKYPIPLVQGYGQTETSLRSTGVPMDLTKPQFVHIRKINSLGTELKYTNVTILKSSGQPAREGEVGDICVSGPCIMAGYLKNPSATQTAFQFNWFHSGDTGYWKRVYGRKFFFMTGRTQEIIKKGGVLISPLAIENALLKNYPDLDQVYAVGFPHPRLGQAIGIVAVTSHPQVINQILAASRNCTLRGLSPYESPQAALTVSEVELPKTSTGKVQRVNIKDIFGPKLLENYRTIYPGFRLIGSEETTILKQAVAINNLRWGSHLQSSLPEFTARAQNGLLIGAFDSKGKLLGTVSAIHINKADLNKSLAKTWDGVTDHGTLATHDHKGDSLLCVAISTAPSARPAKSRFAGRSGVPIRKLTPRLLDQYLASNLDPIIRFHGRAKIVKILKNSRPEDRDSLGYNILMQYPTPTQPPIINHSTTIGTQLIEACLLHAYQNHLQHIYVYTRPAALSKYFKI